MGRQNANSLFEILLRASLNGQKLFDQLSSVSPADQTNTAGDLPHRSLSTEERKKCQAPWHPRILSHHAGIENRTADTFLWFSVVEDIAGVEAAPIGAAVVVVRIGVLPFESGGPV